MNDLTKLAISAREGNRIALGAFIRQTQADVWRVCDHLGPRGMADDLTQDVYIRMMQSLKNFRAESSARTWLISIARHTAIDALRAHRRRERLSLLLSRNSVEEQVDNSVDVDLRHVIATLDIDQRSAFMMTQVLGLSYEEAAHACGCAVGTIRSRVARARDRLVASLAIKEEGLPG